MTAMLTSKQAAERLGIKPQTLDYWRIARPASHQPPFTRIGGRTIRYCPIKLEEWIDKQTTGLDTRKDE